MTLDQLSIKHGLAHDTPNETKVNEMIFWAGYFCGVDFIQCGIIIKYK